MSPAFSFLSSPAFGVALAGHVAVYFLAAATVCRTEKQRAWTMTLLGSLCMSIASLPSIRDYIVSGGDIKAIAARPVWEAGFARTFQAYLVSDLALGALFYPKHVNLLTGWFHHTFYVFVVELCFAQSWLWLFALLALLEVPTFHLALASIYKQFRQNTVFAVTFFLTRIVFHVCIFVSLVLPVNRAALVNGSFVPAGILATVFPMHVMWFKGCLAGFAKRAKDRKIAREQAEQALREATSTTEAAALAAQCQAAKAADKRPAIIVRLQMVRRLSTKEGRRESFQKLLPPTRRKALYDFVGLSYDHPAAVAPST